MNIKGSQPTLPALILLLLLSLTGLRPAYAQFQSVETRDVELLYYHFGHEYLVNHTIRSFTNSLHFHKRLFGYNPDERVTLIMQDFGDFGSGSFWVFAKSTRTVAGIFEFT